MKAIIEDIALATAIAFEAAANRLRPHKDIVQAHLDGKQKVSAARQDLLATRAKARDEKKKLLELQGAERYALSERHKAERRLQQEEQEMRIESANATLEAAKVEARDALARVRNRLMAERLAAQPAEFEVLPPDAAAA